MLRRIGQKGIEAQLTLQSVCSCNSLVVRLSYRGAKVRRLTAMLLNSTIKVSVFA